ncbi:MAG: hypothetical protein F4155_12935 [Acidimicrobiales bacterium]|nr:hypothetical protein [Acidimicrobiaceae bacterium]MYA83564.1 hypothetical protein [Acidimicrobiales bacterium]MYH75690.1 hypothetical protein [Acidimicrobiales bacterium]MYK70745.1 hypothetical protein [Acidimicrobiales bacterium]
METLRGWITSVGFASGHRFVVGEWRHSPIGPFADVMWARPDGRRMLLAESAPAAYIVSVYPFPEVRHQAVTAERNGRFYTVHSDGLRLDMKIGLATLRPPPRPRWITATVENWCARKLLGVHTHGTSPTGVVEWYRTRSARRVVAATASLDGADLGSLARLDRPLGFGFTDPPRQPSHVRLRVDLQQPECLGSDRRSDS